MKAKNDLTRRNLLKSAALGGGATMIIGPQLAIAGDQRVEPARDENRPLSDFEEVLKRCGSEFGEVSDAS